MASGRAQGPYFISTPILLALVIFLSGCAGGQRPHASTAPAVDRGGDRVERAAEHRRSADDGDPYERFNRTVFRINMTLDRWVMRPIAWTYRTILPDFVERMISNGFANAGMPLVIVNSLLQGNLDHAGKAAGRFLVNSTIGIGGLADPATKLGIEKVDEDFGQTLAVWGLEDGPYLVLPFLGPSNPRDALGFVVDSFGDPFMIAMDKLDVHNLQLSLAAGRIVDARARHWDDVNALLEASDPYVLARSAYRQRRRYLIENGAATQSREEEEIFDEDFEDFPEDIGEEPGAAQEGGNEGGRSPGDGPTERGARATDADAGRGAYGGLSMSGFVPPRGAGDDCVLFADPRECARSATAAR